MKLIQNTLFFFAIFLFMTLPASTTYARKTIIDYYNLIPIKSLNDHRLPLLDKKYTLQLKNGTWITRSYDARYEFEAAVDIKNGYLKIADAGTGGGTTTYELALYRTNEGSDFIGVSMTHFDGIGSMCSMKFY
jgi:hypothetical protein